MRTCAAILPYLYLPNLGRYTAETIDVGHTFADAIAHLTNGKLQIDLGQLSKTTPEEPDDLTLPQCF